ncbi:DEAD/DEAH box helicase [Pelagibacterales bacterium]|nr:DEAD/DEAH box helicase [Pelagibacterales bacterium]
MNSFEGLSLSQGLNKALKKIDFKEPTPIQAQAIPLAMAGKDILGSAQTGTGKTAAFSIPLIESILTSDTSMALVLTPTRELAKQVMEVITSLLSDLNHINTACLIGGEQMTRQLKQLKKKPRIIVGTPGRINDHLDRKTLKLNQTNYVVLDETDRMLDMGFGIQIDSILKFVPKTRQTLLFSATIPKEIEKLSSKYLTNPERVSVGATNVVAPNIKHDILKINQEAKYAELLEQVNERDGSLLIFVKTKHGTDKMAKNLSKDGFKSQSLNGNLRQSKRDKVMKDFRNQKFRILVATDIAARGLDVPHIENVINYDLPQLAEDFIHRMGRTGRAGAAGSALSFISPKDLSKWNEIQVMLDPSLKGKVGRGSNKSSKNTAKSSKRVRGNRSNDEGFKKPFKKTSFRKDDTRSEGFKKPFKKTSFRKDDTRSEGFKKPFKKTSFRKDDTRSEGFKKPFKKTSFRKDDTRSEGFKKPFKKTSFRKDDTRSEGFKKPFKKTSFRKDDTRSEGFKKPFKKKTFSRNSQPKNK